MDNERVVVNDTDAKITALSVENEGLRGEIESLNKIIAELKERIREREYEILNKNDSIKAQEAEIEKLKNDCEALAVKICKYKKILSEKRDEDKRIEPGKVVGVSFLEPIKPIVCLEDVLTVVKESGCSSVVLNFAGKEN